MSSAKKERAKGIPLWAGLLVGAAIAPHVAGCGGLIWGNLAVVIVTLGIFFGTLNLGRRIPPTATGRTGPGDSQEADADA